jgi:DUF4097 and DUF4098 domain-containing protein YvlB
MVVDSDTGDISIREAHGDIKATSSEGNISLEGYRGNGSQEPTPEDAGKDAGIHIETWSGDVALANVNGDTKIKSISGNLTLKRMTGNMDLKSEDGNIGVEDFSGKVKVKAKDAGIFLKNSGDAELHIESDGGDINIEDCYADVYIDSGRGDVYVSGGKLSFDAMGKVDLKMRSGNAYIHRRSFEDINVAVAEGSIELNGAGKLSVHKGDITVGVPPSFGCELIVQGSRKKMTIELPVEIIEKDKNRIHGMLNGGGARLEMLAPDGQINFLALEVPNTQENMAGVTSGSDVS